MKISRYKGGKDLLAADMASFRLIESAFRQACLSWGYEEVRTPTIEYLHLFTSAGTLTGMGGAGRGWHCGRRALFRRPACT
ncbi:MAG: hisZ [Dehalococcoidia bacterium]|nr:hisZ [Dehalococcoidia bacterium]